MIGQLFAPEQDVFVEDRLRPHWSQAGAIVFITFRTKDSIPKKVLGQWEEDKIAWLEARGLLGRHKHWSTVLPALSDKDHQGFQTQFNRTREAFLDTCQGKCLLKQPETAEIVAKALSYFDAERYRLGDFIIMPNHVHLLAAFPTPEQMRAQCASWLRFSAREINKQTGEQGHFWQQEPFDHLVRSASQYDYLRQYIADNPTKAGLRPGDFYHHETS